MMMIKINMKMRIMFYKLIKKILKLTNIQQEELQDKDIQNIKNKKEILISKNNLNNQKIKIKFKKKQFLHNNNKKNMVPVKLYKKFSKKKRKIKKKIYDNYF